MTFAPCCGEFLPGERRYVRCDVFDAIDWPGDPPVFKRDGICWSMTDEPAPDPVPKDLVVDAAELTDLYALCNGRAGSDACCEEACWFRAVPCNCIGTPVVGEWGIPCDKVFDLGIPRGAVQTVKIVYQGQVQCWEIDTTIQYGELPPGWGELVWTAFIGLAAGCFECCTGLPECCGCQGTLPPYCPTLPAYATIAWTLGPPGAGGIGQTCQCVNPDSVVTLRILPSASTIGCYDNGGFATANGCLGPFVCKLGCVEVGGGACAQQIFWRLSVAVSQLSTFDYEQWEFSGGAITVCGDCDNEDSAFTNPPCEGVVCESGAEYLVTFRTENMPKCECVPNASAFTIIESKSSNVIFADLVSLS